MACKFIYNNIEYSSKEEFINELVVPNFINQPKTLRVQEQQSDFFQKIRNNFTIKGNNYTKLKDKDNNPTYFLNGKSISKSEHEKGWNEYLDTPENSEDAFLKLLLRNDNWITFFIKATIQNAAKKGYEKVLFPKGETAAKIEGHTTIEDQIKEIDKQLYSVNNENNKDTFNYKGHIYYYQKDDVIDTDGETYEDIRPKGWYVDTKGYGVISFAFTDIPKYILDDIEQRKKVKIEQLEKRKQELKSQGIDKLAPIEAFYEIKVGNILEKQFGKDNVKTITDEFGNQWRELSLSTTKIQEETDDILLAAKVEPKVLPLKGNEQVYERYNLLNKEGKIKIVDNNKVTKDWLEKLNRSPHYSFKLSHSTDGKYRILVTEKYRPEIELDYIDFNDKHNPSLVPYEDEILFAATVKKKDVKLKPENKELVSQLYNRIKSIKKLASRAPEKKLKLYRRINELEEEINTIYEKNNIDNIIDVANKHIDWVESLMSSNTMYTGYITQANRELAVWDLMMEMFTETNDAGSIYYTSEAYKQALQKLDARLVSVKELVKNISEKHFAANVQNKGFKPISKDNMTKMRELDKLNTWFLSLDEVNNKVSEYIDNVLKDANSNAAYMYAQKINEPLKEWVKKSKGKSWDLDTRKGWLKFMQTDKDGKPTGNMITPLSQEYYDQLKELGKLKRTARNTTLKKSVRKRATVKWRNAINDLQVTLDITKLVKMGKDPIDQVERQKYIDSLYKYADKDIVDKAVLEVDKLWDKYVEDVHNVVDDIKDEIDSNPATKDLTAEEKKELKDKELKKWKDRHSPIYYINILNGAMPYMDNTGYLYTVRIPKQYDSKGNKTKWYDGKYEEVMKDSDAREFYTWYSETMKTLMSYLPNYATDRLQSNYLPEVYKDLSELQSEYGIWATRSDLWRKIKDRFTNEDTDEYKYTEVDEKGKPLKHIPIRYTNDKVGSLSRSIKYYEQMIERNETKISQLTGQLSSVTGNDLEELHKVIEQLRQDNVTYSNKILKATNDRKEAMRMKSINLVGIMEKFGLMAMEYKYRSEVEDVVLLGQRIVHKAEEIQTTELGSEIKNQKGTISVKDELNNLKSLVDYTIDANMYGRRNVDTDITDIKTYGTEEDKKKAKEIKEKLSELYVTYTSKANADDSLMTKEQYFNERHKLQEELEGLSSKRNVSVTKSIEQLVKLTYLKALGWNGLAGIVNMVFGTMSNSIYASGKTDFSTQDYNRAIRILLNSTAKSIGVSNNKTAQKVNKLMERLQVLSLIDESASARQSSMTNTLKKLGIFAPFEFNKRAEYFNQGSIMVATMLGIRKTDIGFVTIKQYLDNKLEDFKGSTAQRSERIVELEKEFYGYKVTLWDSFDNDGQPNSNIENASDWTITEELKGTDTNKLTALRNKIIKINKGIHGNYDINSPIQIKKYVLGRVAMIFRSWIPNTVKARFGKYREYDNVLERETKGRYRTMYELGLGGTISTLIGILTRSKTAYRLLEKDVDIENMRKNLKEITYLLMLTGAYLLFKYGVDDDDDDSAKKRVINFIVNRIGRVQQDMLFYVTPSGIKQIIKDPLPVLKTLDDVAGIFKASWDVAYKGTLQGKDMYDEEYWFRKLFKVFPIGNDIIRTTEAFTKSN